MNESTKITLIKNLDVTDLDGDKVMVDFETGKYFLLKGTANDIWELIQDTISIRQIKEKLLAEYVVSEVDCLSSIYQFLNQLVENEFIILSN